MPAESYTPDPALVDLVARAAYDAELDAILGDEQLTWDEQDERCHDWFRVIARAVLAALATEGRPAGGTVEWGWTGYDDKDPQRGMPLRDEEAARSVVALHPGTQLVRRAVGPWLPAPTTETKEN